MPNSVKPKLFYIFFFMSMNLKYCDDQKMPVSSLVHVATLTLLPGSHLAMLHIDCQKHDALPSRTYKTYSLGLFFSRHLGTDF